ncbi:MAG: hypothetical protein JJT95_01515 [Pararhodobacter sp.]|nr:hypothetical protein [Pararhodobacter sp.]
MAELPGELRLLVQLVLIEGLSNREAAEAANCPEGTLRSRLSRARGLLRASLDKHATDAGSDRVVPFPERREQRR